MTDFVKDDVIKVKHGISKDSRGVIKFIINERDNITYFESTYEVLLENGTSDKFKDSELELLELNLFERSLLFTSMNKFEEHDESFTEMATVATNDKYNYRIQVNPDRGRIGDPYFKVFDTTSPKLKISRVVRLHFKDSNISYHSDKYLEWKITKSDIKNIINMLNMKHEDFPKYTNWQMTCFLWNYEYGFDIKRDRYFAGEYDSKFKDDPSYISSNCEMPRMWHYNPKHFS